MGGMETRGIDKSKGTLAMRKQAYVATLALGLQPKQGLAKVQAKSAALESHFMLPGK